ARGARRVSGERADIGERRSARDRARRESATSDGRHTPVLASELLHALARARGGARPGSVAIDCTFGDGGHARLVAERLGTSGTLVAIDRDPVAEEGFARLEREVPCAVRFIRAGYAEALELLAREGLRADLAYFDLGMSWMQV